MAEHGMDFTRRDFVKGATVITGGILVFGAEACGGTTTPTTTTAPPTTTKPLEKLPQLKFQFANTGSNPNIAAFLQGQLKQNLNVDLTLEPMESAAFQNLVNAKNHTWSFYGWGADYPDPENFLQTIYGTNQGNNKSGYSNATVDANIASAMKELDNTKRLALWDSVHKQVVDDCPGIYVFNRERFNLVAPALKPTLKPTGQDGQVMGDRLLRGVSMPSGKLRLNLGGDVNTLDTNIASWASSLSILFNLFDGLLGFDQNLNLVPVVASVLPSTTNGGISADGKTYTFTLKSNVTWSDGKPCTAADFEYSIKRMLAKDTAAEYASMYFNIVGGEAYNAGTGPVTGVGVTALSATSLQIKLVAAQPTFPQVMALWPVYPVRKDVIDSKGSTAAFQAGNLIGNGPFTLTEWVPLDHITLKANANYWGTKPTLTEITFKQITDSQASLAAYKNGEIDMTGVPAGTEKATIADPTYGPQIVRGADLTTYAFQYNMTKAPLTNKLLRQALATAIDRDTYINTIRGGVGHPTTCWIPPGMPGYDATIGAAYKFDAAKAKTLLTQAGYTP
ncbi:ABC transporter substrate-binding protein [Dehalogenimonas etheniformans]|nr:ABC transporter substrate-binding protein [Dehalogenimonas etheniformans]QNT76536.1 hypothetical protein HX448_07505 [Dehalogenimonas etheniformans]